MVEIPDYIICLECETPVYTFEWDGVRIKEATCTACGNGKASLFTTEETYGEMMATESRHYGATED